jgi:Sigma-70, region 4
MSRDHATALEARHARYRQVLTCRAEGLTHAEIAQRLGITPERARTLAIQAQRWQERMHGTAMEQPSPTALRPEMPLESLPVTPNAKKSLRRAGLRTVGAVAALSDAALLDLRDIGPGTVAAIRAAVAAPDAADGGTPYDWTHAPPTE